VIDIQMTSLGAFKQDLFPLLNFSGQNQGRIGDIRPDFFRVRQVLIRDGLGIQRRHAEKILEQVVFFFQAVAHFFQEQPGFIEVAHADARAGNLVFVCRADAAAGGSDFLAGIAGLARLIQAAVIGHDDVRLFADVELGGRGE